MESLTVLSLSTLAVGAVLNWTDHPFFGLPGPAFMQVALIFVQALLVMQLGLA